MKLICGFNSLDELNGLMNKKIDGVLVYINKLSVNASFYMDIDDVLKIDFHNKEVFIVMNKIMHNTDLDLVRYTLNKIKNTKYRIMFYDMGVYNISKSLGLEDRLVIYQDHLNASIGSNNTYYDLGIRGSFVSNDITIDELLEIKDKTKTEIFFLGYGYASIFYSRRYLVRNYMKYINLDYSNNSKYTITSDMGVTYPIREEEYGTSIYTDKVINLINYLDKLEKIDYIVISSLMIDNIMGIVDKFINHEYMDDTYTGFIETKTIFKVKNN